MESVKVISIRGISATDAKKLANAGVKNSLDLLNAATTSSKIAQLSKQTGVSQQKLVRAVQQADLLRVPGVSVDDADVLARVGVANVQALAAADPVLLRNQIVAYRTANPKASYDLPVLTELVSWIGVAKTIAPSLSTIDAPVPVPVPVPAEAETASSPMDTLSVEMSEVISQLGLGIAQAQQALDENAMRTQLAINANETLRELGLQATWYAIPEVTLNLKMEYSVTKEDETSGAASRIRLSPIDAKYRNYFKSTEAAQSQLNLKFNAIPPPQRVMEQVTVPNVLGMSIEQASAALKDCGLQLGTLTTVEGVPAEGRASEVTSQLPSAGNQARFLDAISVAIVKRKE